LEDARYAGKTGKACNGHILNMMYGVNAMSLHILNMSLHILKW